MKRKPNPRPLRYGKLPRTQGELKNAIAKEKGLIAENETEIRNHKQYQESGDEYYIERPIRRIEFHTEKLKVLERALRELRKRKGNPVAKTKRKATPAQLRALKKGRATAARNRRLKKKTPKRKKVARRNPAYSNYQKARSAARGTGVRRANPVRKLAPLYAIKAGARYFDGVRFSSKVGNAARFATLTHCKSVAQKIADKTGKTCAIVNLRK